LERSRWLGRGALLSAVLLTGAGVGTMSHIPKRATQNGIFLSGSEISPPVLKPGQTELHRKDLYIKEAKPVQEPYLFQDQVIDSNYTKSIARITLPEDYEDPTRPMRPPTVTAACGLGGTSHWVSEYKSRSLGGAEAFSEEAEFGRPYIPYDDLGEPPSLLGRNNMNSTYMEEFGKYRSDPRDKIGVNLKRPMDAGTTKGTRHVPGYQGFIPGNTFSDEVARIENGDFNRSVDKTNIEQTYHLNLIGYSGHQPKSALNDRGGKKPSGRETVYGHDFPDPTHLMKENPQAKMDAHLAAMTKSRT